MGAVLAGVLLWLLLDDSRPPAEVHHDPMLPPPGPIPGVPPDLQVPLAPTPLASTSILPPEGLIPGVPAELQQPLVMVTDVPSPSPAPSPTRQTRVSVQPDELPSSPELRRLPIEARAEGRRLAIAAAVAVRAESSRDGRRAPLEAVRQFQGYVAPQAGVVDGKWGHATAAAARMFAGPVRGIPGAVW